MKSDDERRWPLWAILTAGGLLHAAFAFLPMDILIRYVLPDDSYYYFQIAANIGRGLGPTVDGVNLTNGFHPLWAYLITPLFWLKALNADVPVRLVMLLAAALDVVAAFFIYRTVKETTASRPGGLLAAACFLAAPTIFMRTVAGEVTAATLALVAAATWWFARLLAREGRRRDFALMGVLLGLMVLARSDMAIYGAAAAVILLVRLWKARRLGAAAALVVPPVALAAPWLVWNVATFGTVVQVSAVAMPYVYHGAAGPAGPGELISRLGGVITDFGGYTHFSPFAGFTLVAVGLTWAFFAAGPPERRRLVLPLLTLTAAAFVVFVIHVGVRGYNREWYFSEIGVAAALAVGAAVALYPAERRRLWAWLVFAAWLVAGVPFAVKRVARSEIDHQIEMRRGADWVNAHAVGRVAAFNGGIVAYYADNRVTVVDGNVNNAAFAAIRARHLYDYLRSQDLRYIVDYDGPIYWRYRAFWPPPLQERIRLAADLDLPAHKYGGYRYGVYALPAEKTP